MVQWLGLCSCTAGGTALNPGWGTEILHSAWHGQNNFFFRKSHLEKGGKSFLEMKLSYKVLNRISPQTAPERRLTKESPTDVFTEVTLD